VVIALCFSVCTHSATPIYQINHPETTFIQASLNHEIFQCIKVGGLQDLVVLDADKNLLPYRFFTAVSDYSD
jgi:hypothetical protein